jgi:hypothetical protein
VKDETLTVPPDVIDVLLRFRSQPEVPTLPCISGVNTPELTLPCLKKVAVPVASALVSELIAAAVATPDAALPYAGSDITSAASRVLPDSAALTSAGMVPL